MTNQEIFEIAVWHFLYYKRYETSMDIKPLEKTPDMDIHSFDHHVSITERYKFLPKYKYRYNGKIEPRCSFISLLILDESYTPEMDGKTVKQLITEGLWQPRFTDANISLLEALQESQVSGDLPQWEENLHNVATTFQLEFIEWSS